jgi:hypothetical protein
VFFQPSLPMDRFTRDEVDLDAIARPALQMKKRPEPKPVPPLYLSLSDGRVF